MSHLSRSAFLLIVTLFVVHIQTAILFEYNSTTTNVNVSSSGAANPICYDDTHITLHPNTQDCLRAHGILPGGEGSGMFHREGPDDGFRVPVFASSGTCTIVVNLESFTRADISSWNIISLRTRSLIEICSVGRSSEAKTGGYTHVGLGRRIRISLLRIGSADLGLDNTTASASTS